LRVRGNGPPPGPHAPEARRARCYVILALDDARPSQGRGSGRPTFETQTRADTPVPEPVPKASHGKLPPEHPAPSAGAKCRGNPVPGDSRRTFHARPLPLPSFPSRAPRKGARLCELRYGRERPGPRGVGGRPTVTFESHGLVGSIPNCPFRPAAAARLLGHESNSV